MDASRRLESECSRCGKAAVAGVMRDSRGITGTRAAQSWMPPATGSNFIAMLRSEIAQASGELPVVAYRCLSCGHLDLYVVPHEEAP